MQPLPPRLWVSFILFQEFTVNCSSNHETDKGAIPETSKSYVGCEIESHANNVILPVYLLCICYLLCNVDSHRTAHPLLRGLQTHMRTDISAHFELPPAEVTEGVPPHLHPTPGNLACICVTCWRLWLWQFSLDATTSHHLSLSWSLPSVCQHPSFWSVPCLEEGEAGLTPSHQV